MRTTGFAVAALVLGLDQLTKHWADLYLRSRAALEIVPGFLQLTYWRNPGGVFGFFTGLGEPWRGLLLTALPLAAAGMITVLLWRARTHTIASTVGLGLVLGGAVGNLVDRVLRGAVIDFLDVYVPPGALADRLERWFGTAHWPTFNVADSAIVVGAGLLLIATTRTVPDPAPAPVAPRD